MFPRHAVSPTEARSPLHGPVPEVGHAVPAEMDGPSLATLLRRALPAPAPPPPLPALSHAVAVCGSPLSRQ